MFDERIGFVISGEKRFQVLVKSTFQSFPPTKNETVTGVAFGDFILLCISF